MYSEFVIRFILASIPFITNFLKKKDILYGKSLRKSYHIRLKELFQLLIKVLVISFLLVFINSVFKYNNLYLVFYLIFLSSYFLYENYLISKTDNDRKVNISFIKKIQTRLFFDRDKKHELITIAQYIIAVIYSSVIYGIIYELLKKEKKLDSEMLIIIFIFIIMNGFWAFFLYRSLIRKIANVFFNPSYFKVIINNGNLVWKCSDVQENKKYYVLRINKKREFKITKEMQKYICENTGEKEHILLIRKSNVDAISFSVDEIY